ncbi:hypothetical protein Lal_00007665 [Lupinus albus]|nr:hypothetical protein Lal_00007665 [Lupinus albus]
MGVHGSPPPIGLSHYSYDSQWHFAVVKGKLWVAETTPTEGPWLHMNAAPHDDYGFGLPLETSLLPLEILGSDKIRSHHEI